MRIPRCSNKMSMGTCLGGPWDNKRVLAPPVGQATLVFKVGAWRGRYRRNHPGNTVLEWEGVYAP